MCLYTSIQIDDHPIHIPPPSMPPTRSPNPAAVERIIPIAPFDILPSNSTMHAPTSTQLNTTLPFSKSSTEIPALAQNPSSVFSVPRISHTCARTLSSNKNNDHIVMPEKERGSGGGEETHTFKRGSPPHLRPRTLQLLLHLHDLPPGRVDPTTQGPDLPGLEFLHELRRLLPAPLLLLLLPS